MSKVLIRVACLCLASLVLLGGPAAQDGPGEPPHATGLIPLDARRLDEIVSTWPRVVGVRLNPLGLERVNEVRARKGEPPLGPESTVQVGREVEWSLARGASVLAAAPNPAMAGDLPVKVDNSLLRYFPPIRNQGPLGSCASFASTYVQLSYMTAFQRDLDIRNSGDNTNKYSPKWSYNMLNGGVNEGTYFLENYQLLEKNGAATWAEFPYDSDYRAWCLSPSVWRNALSVRTQRAQYVRQASSDAGMELIKELLADGYVLVFGTYFESRVIKTASDDPSTADDDAAAGKAVIIYLNGTEGSHAMTIVGYNDAVWTDINSNGILDPGERGAFRIANSWGPGWGEAGFIWLAYDALNSVSEVYDAPTGARVRAFQDDMVYVLTARDDYAPQMIAEFTVSLAKRDQLRLSLGRSDPSTETPTTSWVPMAFQRQGGPYAFDGTTTPVAATFVLDFTDILAAGSGLQRHYLVLSDSASGDPASLSAFKIVDLTKAPPTESASTMVPQIADGSEIAPFVDYDFVGPGYNYPPELSSPRVDPATGRPGATFTFTVYYSDPDDDAPAVANVVIDGVPRTMAPESGGQPAHRNYSLACGLPTGPHSFHFQFEDARGGAARMPLAGEIEGPFVYSHLLNSVSPSSASAGGPSFVLTVNGTDLPSGSVVTWDGADRPTTFVSSSRVDAAIDSADLVSGRIVALAVRDPAGGYGNAVSFTVANPRPFLTSISPWQTSGGGASLEVTLSGSGFVPDSLASYEGVAKPTNFVSATELRTTLSSADLDQGGQFLLGVVNPSPGGGSAYRSLTLTSFTVRAGVDSKGDVFAGYSASYTIWTTYDIGSFDAPISFVCDGLPLGSRATFSPATVTPGMGSATTQMTISTTSRAGTLASLAWPFGSIPPAPGLALILAFSAFAVAGFWRGDPFRALVGRRAAAIVLILLVVWLAACGAGGGGSEKQGTPAGTYSIKVTGKSGSLQASTTVTLKVS